MCRLVELVCPVLVVVVVVAAMLLGVSWMTCEHVSLTLSLYLAHSLALSDV